MARTAKQGSGRKGEEKDSEASGPASGPASTQPGM